MSDNVLSADNQQERLRQTINPWYIVGFVEGEGSFHVAFYKDNAMKYGIKIIPEFHISQSYLRVSTLEEIQNYFKCGYLKANHKNNHNDDTYVLVIRDRMDLLDKIIPFFRKYPMLSIKQTSFELFSEVVSLMANKKHSEKDGIIKIINLAYKMNISGKYRKVTEQSLINVVKSSETTC